MVAGRLCVKSQWTSANAQAVCWERNCACEPVGVTVAYELGKLGEGMGEEGREEGGRREECSRWQPKDWGGLFGLRRDVCASWS